MSRLFAGLALLLMFVCPAVAEPLRILAWNVESRASSPAKIAEELGQYRDCHLVGLAEAGRDDLGRYATVLAGENRDSRRYIGGLTGTADRLLIVYDTQRLQLVSYSELFRQGQIPLVDDGWGRPAPLVCQFHDAITGTDFLVVLNHLARHDVGLRQQQAKGLRLWAAAQTLPVIAMGDFNFDYNFATQAGNAAFTEFLSDDTWKWVRPEPLVDTNWADHDGNGSDDYPNSMLDFVFVAGAARGWEATCSVVVRAGDFPDDQTTSDHRPVSCMIDVPSAGGVESIETSIREVLDDQVAAWNAADLDRFMRHYWKSDQLTFSSEGQTQRGWTATMQRYQDRYPTPEKMGQLQFSELDVQPLGPTAALVLGRWHLTRSDEQLEGNFSLVFGQIEGRWQIMHDHTSLVRREH